MYEKIFLGGPLIAHVLIPDIVCQRLLANDILLNKA